MSSRGNYKEFWAILKEKKSLKLDLMGLPQKQVVRMISKEKNEDPVKNIHEQIKVKVVSPGIILLELKEVCKTRLKYIGF